MNQGSGDGGIDTATQTKDDTFFANSVANLADGLFDVIGHGPLPFTFANLKQEIGEHFHTHLGVRHFGVKLHTVEITLWILDSCEGRVFS